MATTYFSGFGDQKILAERAEKAEKDVNGNSLELTVVDNKITAIGGKGITGSSGEPLVFDGNYDPTTNPAATVSTVT